MRCKTRIRWSSLAAGRYATEGEEMKNTGRLSFGHLTEQGAAIILMGVAAASEKLMRGVHLCNRGVQHPPKTA